MKPADSKTVVDKRTGSFLLKPIDLIFHEDVYYKIGGYLILGLLLFFATWAIFMFLVKKPNLLADSLMVQKLFKVQTLKSLGPWGAKTFGTTWHLFSWKIDVAKAFAVWGNVILITFEFFLNHLIFIILFIFGLNLFKIGRINLGVIYFGLYTILWGITIGTGSLSYPVGNNAVWGSLVLFARYGLWNWFSYLLLLVSSTQFSWLATPGWSTWSWGKTRKFWPFGFTSDQIEVFIYGLLFLLASSFAEARIFVHYNS